MNGKYSNIKIILDLSRIKKSFEDKIIGQYWANFISVALFLQKRKIINI